MFAVTTLSASLAFAPLAQMVEMYEEELQTLKEADEVDASGDGQIDEFELREYLTIKKKVRSRAADATWPCMAHARCGSFFAWPTRHHSV